MKKLGSPHVIKVLLHCYISPEPLEHGDMPLYQDTLIDLMQAGAIEQREAGKRVYNATPLGEAWVIALCNVPPPKMAFIDEVGRVISSL